MGLFQRLDEWQPSANQIIGGLCTLLVGAGVYIFTMHGRVNETAVAGIHARISGEAERTAALEQWTQQHDDWSNQKLHTILDSIRTVGELGERGRLEAWQRFAIMFQYNDVLADYLEVPKHRRPVMPDRPDDL